MKSLIVNLREKSYPIHIGGNLIREAGGLIRRVSREDKIAIISDCQIWELHGGKLEAALVQAGFEPVLILIPPGEASKSLESYETICEKLAKAELKRPHMLIAFGGGVVGDLAGFAAATYMRGISYIQIPTTLLAQVDSSVGGKTGLNLRQGKNLIGAFWQPKMVIADTRLLTTLSERDFASGMAEVIKYAAIASSELFARLQALGNRGQAQAEMEEIILRCCEIKSSIVARDERDTGERMLLNFGHTFGHALEKRGDYSAYTHGEGVAIGMVIAAALGEHLGITAPGCARQLEALLNSYGLPVKSHYPLEELIGILELDKKGLPGRLRLILLKELGEALIHEMNSADLSPLLQKLEGEENR